MYKHYRKLADLHTHLYGYIDSADFLEFLRDRDVDWTAYQSNFQRVYGVIPPIMEILDSLLPATFLSTSQAMIRGYSGPRWLMRSLG